MTDREKVEQWLVEHPAAARAIGTCAVMDLYFPEGADDILSENDDFPSGADYIDEVCSALGSVRIMPLLTELQAAATKRQEAEENEQDNDNN